MTNAASLGSLRSADAPLDQYALAPAIVLHLLPGVVGTAVYVLSVPILAVLGYPSITALYLPMILAVILLELGYLFSQRRKQIGQRSGNAVIAYREPVARWWYVVFPFVILVWGILATGLVSPLDNWLLNAGFGWLPDWYALRDLLQIKTAYSREALLVTGICALLLNGLAGPIVEELYFRGHLLPRLARFGRWAPLLNVLLFSLYHGWTPWMFFSRVVLLLPMVYGVWWKRNIYLGMIAHCLLNLIGTTVLFAQLLG